MKFMVSIPDNAMYGVFSICIVIIKPITVAANPINVNIFGS